MSDPVEASEQPPSRDLGSDDPGATRLAVASGPLVGPVLRRVVGMLAARADLPLDRLDDAVLVADVIASRASTWSPESVQVTMVPGERTLWLQVGPLQRGGADALLGDSAVPDVGSVIVKLADEVEVDAGGDEEYVRVRLAYVG